MEPGGGAVDHRSGQVVAYRRDHRVPAPPVPEPQLP